MEIKNKVILEFSDGVFKNFTCNLPILEIKEKYQIGKWFLMNTNPFKVAQIESMTCYSAINFKKTDRKQMEKNMNFIRKLLK